MKEYAYECIKNAKDVLDAVGPLVLQHDESCILTQGVATARNWCERILNEDGSLRWNLVGDKLPNHYRAVAIFPPHKGHGFATWNSKEDCWDDESGDDYMCDKDAVKAWFEIPAVPRELYKLL